MNSENNLTTKEKILNTAINIFYDEGFHNTPLRKIASVVGISHVTIIHYFGTKNKIGAEIRFKHRQLILNEAIKIYESIPESKRTPVMGILAYHSLIFKHLYIDKKFARNYYEFRLYANKEFVELYEHNFMYANLAKLFPGVDYISDNTLMDLGTDIINDCIKNITYYMIDDKITPKKATIYYFHIYSFLQLKNHQVKENEIENFYDDYIKDYDLNADKILQQMISK